MVDARNMRPADESGNVAPLTVAILFALIVLAGLVVDIAMATVQQQLQTNDLAAARDDMLSAPNSLVLKNSDNPGLFTARTVVDSLRRNGYEGKVTVWYFEADASEVASGRRALAWAAQTETTMPALFMAFSGVDELETGSYVVGSAMPYSLGKTWRPTVLGNGRYVVEADMTSADISYTAVESAEDCPAELVAALEARKAEAQAS